jgi:ELWxxDGT repeat protein
VLATFQEAFIAYPLGTYLFFTADDGINGGELWITDGTIAGTRRQTDIWPGPGTGAAIFETNSQYPELAVVGDTLFFNANDGVHGFEPWAWHHPILADCNGNGRADYLDIADGTLRDANHDAVPDSCQCLADWNGSGADDEQDVFDFLALWFEALAAQGESADVNGDGQTNADDIFAYLLLWFNGC